MERQLALDLLARIEQGEIGFVAAANKHSTCGSAATGGALGSFRCAAALELGSAFPPWAAACVAACVAAWVAAWCARA